MLLHACLHVAGAWDTAWQHGHLASAQNALVWGGGVAPPAGGTLRQRLDMLPAQFDLLPISLSVMGARRQ